MEKISASQAAKLLGISVDKLGILEKQGLIHSTLNIEDVSSYSAEEITRIKSRRGPTLAEEAAQVDAEIQQEVFTSVSGLVKLRKRASVLGAGLSAVFILLLIVITTLFYKYPLATSDFFGYYYRFNATGKLQALSATASGKNVLGATTGPDTAPVKTSVLADVIKPVAATSLVLIKAVDNQKYQQIATDPFLGTGQAGPQGSQGSPGTDGTNGTNGSNGADGQPGLTGPQGLIGPSGSNGTNGADGISAPISGLTAANLTAGDFSSKITSGTYSINITGSVASATNFTGTLSGDVTGTQGSTVLKNTGTAGSYGSGSLIPVFTTDAQGRVTGVTNTTISGLTNSNLSGSAGITNANLANSSISFLTGTTGSDFNISGTPSLGGTLTLNIPNASASNRGLLTSSDWSTFYGKQNALGYTPLNSASNLSDLASASTTRTNLGLGSLAIQSGTFSGVSSGTNTGDQAISLTGDVTGSGTGSFATSLKNTGTAGTYGSATNIPVFVTDAQGRVSGVTNTAISGLTVSNFGSANISQWTNNSGYLTSEADTLASVTGRGATTATALTLSNISNAITAGTLTATGGTINGTTIGATSPSTGVFTTINGLTITNSGTNTLTIAAGKTVTVNNSITFGGTDGATFTLPTATDTLVGRSSTDTLTNKTIAAGSNTISGLTNSNLSGSAGITNANLANSSITTAGNSGSGSVSLGGGLTFTGAGITNIVASGSTLTVTSTEADTLASVTGRGASTSTALTLNGGVTTTTSTALTLDSGTTGNVSVGAGANAKTVTIGNTTGATGVNINSGTGNINFTVDSTASSGKVQIGNSGTATPDLLVLDNGTADPTGVNGGMYYNTTSGKFRCYEASAWKDCDTTSGSGSGIVTKSEASDLTTGSTTLQNTNLSFAIGASETWTAWFAIRSFNSVNAQDVNYAISAPAGATCYLASGTFKNGTSSDTTSCAATTITPTVGTTDELVVLAVTIVNSTTAGTVTLKYDTTNAVGTAHVDAGSSMKAFKNQGSDLAEVYYTTDDTIGPGSVVAIDPTIEAGVKGTIRPYDQYAIGVLSTLPGLVIGDSTVPTGTRPVYLALSGRVPVKVSTENGKINAGDYLTSSSTPGVSMKATVAGAIIGTAMSSFEGEGIGQVLVFVKNGSSMGSSDILTQLLSGANGVNDVASNSAQLAKTESTSETNVVGYITQIVSDLFKNTVEFFGNVIFHTNVSFLGRATFNSDTGGFALINAGALEVTVNFDKEYQNVPVVIGSPDTAVLYSITDVSTKGFKIKLTQIEKHDIKFSWTATAIKDAKTSVGTAPTPTPEAGMPASTEIPTVSPSSTPSMIPTDIPSITPSGTASPSAQPIP